MIEVKGTNIAATNIEDTKEKLSVGGIIIPEEGFQARGIRPRWCKAYKVGSEITNIKEGDWLYVEHGRWTHGINTTDVEGNDIKVWMIDHNGIMAVSDTKPKESDM